MVGRNRLFARRRDGRIEIRLNELGRATAREAFGHVVAAERDPDHEWHTSLNAPIDPGRDQDDPVATMSRENEIASNAELAFMTLDEEFLNEAEAWAWLSTLQLALRATALAKDLLNEKRLADADEVTTTYIHTLQQFLFDLADCL